MTVSNSCFGCYIEHRLWSQFFKPHCFRDWCCFDSCLLYWITM